MEVHEYNADNFEPGERCTRIGSPDDTVVVEYTPESVIRLTIELPTKQASELAGLLAGHVSHLNFPWAKSIYDALKRADIRCADVFTDSEHGPDIFLQRKARPSRNG